ncbi:hypothetical protein FKW77_009778 [Venturia effusa]|uniref:GA4 desaturase n=1 Tax=Venturia effusa TaxID=50376 RepID=A0A517L686_9PEZI|nr:hypothetical protein FKW77_009778 [Venturia effusa]
MTLTATTTSTKSQPSIETKTEQNPSLDLAPTDYHNVTPYTIAKLNYWKDSDPIPEEVKKTLSDHDLRVTRRSENSPNVDPHLVKIQNIRGLEHHFSIAKNGFEIAHLPSKMTAEDWTSEKRLKEIYFAEISSLLKKATGAKYVHSYEHMIRLKSLSEALSTPSDGQVDISGPIRRVHIDESPSSARREFRYYLNPARATSTAQKALYTELQNRPFGIYNVWKPLKPIRRDPLALCNPSSLAASDLRIGHVTVPNVGEIENFAIRAPPVGEEGRHEWCFLKGQQVDEALVFKIFDSRDSRGEGFEREEFGWGLERSKNEFN